MPRKVAWTTIHLDLTSPPSSSSLPEGIGRAALKRLLLGLAPDEACHATDCCQRSGGLLHRRFTLTGLDRRSVLCCAVSQVTLGGRYPPSCSTEPGSSSTRILHRTWVAVVKGSRTHHCTRRLDGGDFHGIGLFFGRVWNSSPRIRLQCTLPMAKSPFGPSNSGSTA